MYIELHDLLYILALQKGDYDVDISLESEHSNVEETTTQVLRGEFKTDKNRLAKTENNFFHRTKTLQVWYPSKTDMKSIEKIQQKATKWICGGNDEYH